MSSTVCCSQIQNLSNKTNNNILSLEPFCILSKLQYHYILRCFIFYFLTLNLVLFYFLYVLSLNFGCMFQWVVTTYGTLFMAYILFGRGGKKNAAVKKQSCLQSQEVQPSPTQRASMATKDAASGWSLRIFRELCERVCHRQSVSH